MSRHLVAVPDDTSLTRAWEQMKAHHIRHLPVIDAAGAFVGLVSDRDILAVMGMEHAGQHRIADVMQRDIEAVGPDCCVEAAARFMLRSKKSCLPVLEDGGHLVGLVTEADFLFHLLAGAPICACAPTTFIGSS